MYECAMPSIALKYVVSFSSQDARHKVDNLLQPSEHPGRWLASPDDRSGQLEAEFQLERACYISHIDLGTCWTFSVTVAVGRSSWPSGQTYKTLVPSTTFMTPMDCKMGNNKETVRMFKADDFSANVCTEAWDRLKVTLCQPFRKDVQQGISLIRVTTLGSPQNHKSSNVTVKDTDNSHLLPTSQIRSHFLGKKETESARVQSDLKSRLAKMDATAANSPSSSAVLSRNARLVMASASSNSPHRNKALVITPSVNTKKRKPTLEEDAALFINSLDKSKLDLDNMTFADLRHKYERQKLRKLSKDDKKTFFRVAKEHIEKMASKGIISKNLSSSVNDGTPADHHTASPTSVVASRGIQRQSYELPVPSPSQGSTEGVWLSKQSAAAVSPHTKGTPCSKPVSASKTPCTPRRAVTNRCSTPKRRKIELEVTSTTTKTTTPMTKTPTTPMTTPTEKIRSIGNPSTPLTPRTMCPFCFSLFPNSRIAVHASKCDGSSSLMSDKACDQTCGKPEEFSDCPICGDFFPITLLPAHADRCADVSYHHDDAVVYVG